MTTRIFISYRRADSRQVTERLYDRLANHFGTANVFKDVSSIHAGADFRNAIYYAIRRCNVVLVVIGKEWASSTNESGMKRLFDPADFVRLEVENALANPKTMVIPLLVNEAQMPSAAELPPSLHNLLYRNAIPIRHDPDFHNDVNSLIAQLPGYRPQRTGGKRGSSGLALTLMGLLGSVGGMIVMGLICLCLVGGGLAALGAAVNQAATEQAGQASFVIDTGSNTGNNGSSNRSPNQTFVAYSSFNGDAFSFTYAEGWSAIQNTTTEDAIVLNNLSRLSVFTDDNAPLERGIAGANVTVVPASLMQEFGSPELFMQTLVQGIQSRYPALRGSSVQTSSASGQTIWQMSLAHDALTMEGMIFMKETPQGYGLVVGQAYQGEFSQYQGIFRNVLLSIRY